jgi:hypothetical protein
MGAINLPNMRSLAPRPNPADGHDMYPRVFGEIGARFAATAEEGVVHALARPEAASAIVRNAMAELARLATLYFGVMLGVLDGLRTTRALARAEPEADAAAEELRAMPEAVRLRQLEEALDVATDPSERSVVHATGWHEVLWRALDRSLGDRVPPTLVRLHRELAAKLGR